MGSAFPLHEAEVRAEGRPGCSGLGAWGAHFCWVLAVGTQRKQCREVWRLPAPPFPQCGSFQANIPTPSWQVTDLHQELAEARRAVTELESEREQKQRDFDRKLLLAKSRIETEEASPLGRVTGSCQPCCPALADLPPTLDPAGREGEAGHGGEGSAAEDAVPAGAAGSGHQAAGIPGKGDPEAEQGGGRGTSPHCKMSLMFSSLFTSLKSKTDPDNPFLPRQRLYQAYHLCEAHHISLGSQEGGFKEGLLSLLPLPSYTHFPRWAHARGPPETSWALNLL